MNDPLPPKVIELVVARVRSIEALEVLVLLERARPRAFTDVELAQQLNLAREAVSGAVDELVASGLSEKHASGVHYAPRDAELERLVAELVSCYAKQRVELLVLISNQALSRVRRGALRTFSEAFRLRGPKKDG